MRNCFVHGAYGSGIWTTEIRNYLQVGCWRSIVLRYGVFTPDDACMLLCEPSRTCACLEAHDLSQGRLMGVAPQ